MIASKKIVEESKNFEPLDEVLTFEELKIKNAREWKYAIEEDKTKYSWHMKEKYQGKEDIIHLYSTAFPYIQSDYHSLGLSRYMCDFMYINCLCTSETIQYLCQNLILF